MKWILPLLLLPNLLLAQGTVTLTFSVQGRLQARNEQSVDTQRRMAVVVKFRHVSADPDVTTTLDSVATWTTRGGDPSESTMHFGTYEETVLPENTYRFWMEFFQVEEFKDGAWQSAVDPTHAYSPLIQVWIPPWSELVETGDDTFLNGEIVDFSGGVDEIVATPAGKVAVEFDNFTVSADWDVAQQRTWGELKADY